MLDLGVLLGVFHKVDSKKIGDYNILDVKYVSRLRTIE